MLKIDVCFTREYENGSTFTGFDTIYAESPIGLERMKKAIVCNGGRITELRVDSVESVPEGPPAPLGELANQPDEKAVVPHVPHIGTNEPTGYILDTSSRPEQVDKEDVAFIWKDKEGFLRTNSEELKGALRALADCEKGSIFEFARSEGAWVHCNECEADFERESPVRHKPDCPFRRLSAWKF